MIFIRAMPRVRRWMTSKHPPPCWPLDGRGDVHPIYPPTRATTLSQQEQCSRTRPATWCLCKTSGPLFNFMKRCVWRIFATEALLQIFFTTEVCWKKLSSLFYNIAYVTRESSATLMLFQKNLRGVMEWGAHVMWDTCPFLLQQGLCWKYLLLYNFLSFVWNWFLVWVYILRLLGVFLLNSNTNYVNLDACLRRKKRMPMHYPSMRSFFSNIWPKPEAKLHLMVKGKT